MSSALDTGAALKQVLQWWTVGNSHNSTPAILPTIKEYIAIPNQSPAFDPDVLTNGHQDKAVELLVNWAEGQKPLIQGLQIRVERIEGLTPVIVCEVPATSTEAAEDTVLMYGHMDKQPPMHGWEDGLGPWTPVERDGKLYGRGGADDGYALFASLSSIALLQQQNVPHARIVVLIEADEESGSSHLPQYLTQLAPTLRTPSLVVCLDSGCGNYQQLWLTSSLRGMLVVDVKVSLLREGVHSGMASGIVPSTFRIQRVLLDRVEDAHSGRLPDYMYADIPEHDKAFARKVAEVVGSTIVDRFPFIKGAGPVFEGGAKAEYETEELAQLLLSATWRPTISYTGVEGVPPFPSAGNVLRPSTALKLSIRLPPSVDPAPVLEQLKQLLTRDPPYGASVEVSYDKGQIGWAAPPLEPWLLASLEQASQAYYGKGFLMQGEGGSIPFMGMLGERYPKTQFVITGVLGPASNAHGPNEFLHIGMAQKLTCCVANVLADHAVRNSAAK